jgi:hypothetical protein
MSNFIPNVFSKMRRQLSMTAENPTSLRHPGCVHWARADRTQTASILSTSRLSNAL